MRNKLICIGVLPRSIPFWNQCNELNAFMLSYVLRSASDFLLKVKISEISEISDFTLPTNTRSWWTRVSLFVYIIAICIRFHCLVFLSTWCWMIYYNAFLVILMFDVANANCLVLIIAYYEHCWIHWFNILVADVNFLLPSIFWLVSSLYGLWGTYLLLNKAVYTA